MPTHRLLALLSVLSSHGEAPRMRRGAVEGPLAQLPPGNTSQKSPETKPGCGAVCAGVKGWVWGFTVLIAMLHLNGAYLESSI